MGKKLINGEESFTIDKCECCGFVAYNAIVRCPQCGNMIMVSEKVTGDQWRPGAVRERVAKLRKENRLS